MKIPPSVEYDEVHEVSPDSILLVKKLVSKSKGAVIEIRQLFKQNNKIVEGGILQFPVYAIMGVLDSLHESFARKISQLTPQERLSQWMGEAFHQAKFSSSSVPLPIQQDQRFSESAAVTPERLQEGVANTPFTLEDVVYHVQKGQAFSQKIKLPLHQMKVVLYYGFLGKRPTITMDIEKALLRLNISYDYLRTGAVLKELAREGLMEFEDRISQRTNRQYFLWKFPSVPTDPSEERFSEKKTRTTLKHVDE